MGEIDMGETTTNTKKWESVPDVAKRLIRQQYSDYCSLVANWKRKRKNSER
jgi:hypothetical protein